MAQGNNDDWAGAIALGVPVFLVVGAVVFGLWIAIAIASVAFLFVLGGFAIYSMVRLWNEDRSRFYIAGGIALAVAIVGMTTQDLSGLTSDKALQRVVLFVILAAAPFAYFGFELRLNDKPPAQPEPHGVALGDGEPTPSQPAHDPAFDFDPSRFGGGEAAPASSSREVATVGADNDETDERLWRMAQDPRTPEGERQAAMKAIRKRGNPIPRTQKR